MKKLLAALLLSTAFVAPALAGSTGGFAYPGATPSGNLPFTPAQVFNIADSVLGLPGAKCDGGTTDDDAAINRTLAAAAASDAYQLQAGVKIVGPGNTKLCKIHAANLTVFNLGNGSAPYPVDISELNLFCTHPADPTKDGNCFDLSGANYVHVHEVAITGDSASMPETCFQLGTLSAGVSSSKNKLINVQCHGTFGLMPLLNVGAEDDVVANSTFENNNTILGPIGTLGTIIAGSGGTPATYTGVVLTGGTSGKHDALATIIVNGDGTVHAGGVTITYQGRRYLPGETLTAVPSTIGNTTGFSVPVAAIKNYIAAVDGVDHWRFHSDFATVTLTPEAVLSQTLDTFGNVNLRQAGTGGVLWTAHTGGFHTINTYAFNGAGTEGVEFYDNGTGQQHGSDLGLNIEGPSLTSAFLLSGPNATQIISDFKWRGYHQATGSTIATASGVASVALNSVYADQFYTVGNTVPFFDTPANYSCSGGAVSVHNAANWNGGASCNVLVVEDTKSFIPHMNFTGGTVTPAPGIAIAGALGSTPSLSSGGEGVLFTSASQGAALQGDGATNDIVLKNKGGSNATTIPTGTVNFGIVGAHLAQGAVPTPSGSCAVNTQTGGSTAGTFKANGACGGGSVTLTFPQAVTTGFTCDAHDQTTPADLMNQTGSGTTFVTFVGTMASLDVVAFKCIGY